MLSDEAPVREEQSFTGVLLWKRGKVDRHGRSRI
jgi:hypothetical protein